MLHAIARADGKITIERSSRDLRFSRGLHGRKQHQWLSRFMSPPSARMCY